MHAVGILVLYVPLHVGAEGNWGSMQTGHVMKQPLGSVSPHCAKLYGRIKRLCCDYGSWHADKIAQLRNDLKKFSGVVVKRELQKRWKKGIQSPLSNITIKVLVYEFDQD